MKDILLGLRKNKGMTQQEVADAIQVARNTYTQYELGRRLPDYETIKKLAAYHNVTVDYLLHHGPSDTVDLANALSHIHTDIYVDGYKLLESQREHLLTIIRTFVKATQPE